MYNSMHTTYVNHYYIDNSNWKNVLQITKQSKQKSLLQKLLLRTRKLLLTAKVMVANRKSNGC